QQTLNSIKNFFNSFRSVIEKVTDTKFGNSSLDLFSQNLAISSKANILTATANHKAQEGTYNINVNNLATNTQASSGFSQVTTQTISATATLGSTLTSLGVKAGKIGVTVNGIERNVKIGNDETIQSFIEKLNNIGAKASYNENSGVFSINLSTSDIRDIDNTGIVKALHLQGVNEGYATNTLQTVKVDTVYEQATRDTKLSELGVKNGTITFSLSGLDIPMTLDSSNITIGQFVDGLNNLGCFDVKFEDGCITMNSDATLKSDGGTGLFEILGWDNSEVISTSQTSNKLQYTSTLVEGTVADRNTLLKDIDGVTVNNGDTIIVKSNSNTLKTITLSQTSTIGNVLDGLNSAGLSANINSKGEISISDGSIVGGTFDIVSALNLETTESSSSATSNPIYKRVTIAQDVTSTATVTYTGVRDAVESDYIEDIVGSIAADWIVINDKNGQMITNEIVPSENLTFQELFDYLGENGIIATMKDGVITVNSSDGRYLENTGIAAALGIGTVSSLNSSTVTTAVTKTSDTLYYTKNVTATSDDNIANYINCTMSIRCTYNDTINHASMLTTISGATGVIVDSDGNEHEIFTGLMNLGFFEINSYNYVKTFDDLFNQLTDYGITATMSDGVITLNSSNGAYVKGDLFEQLGIRTLVASSKPTTVGVSLASTAMVTYTIASEESKPSYDPLTANSKITDWWNVEDGYKLQIKVFDTTKAAFTNGNQLSQAQLVKDFDFDIDSTTTFQGLIDNINYAFSHYGGMGISAYWDGHSLVIEAGLSNNLYLVLDEYNSSTGFSRGDSNFKYQRRGDSIGLSEDVAFGIMNSNSTDDAAFKTVQLTYYANEDTYYHKSVTGIEGISTSTIEMTENSRVLDWWVGTAANGELYKLDSYSFELAQRHFTITRDTTFGDLINKINSYGDMEARLVGYDLTVTIEKRGNMNFIEDEIFQANKEYGINNDEYESYGLYYVNADDTGISLFTCTNQAPLPIKPVDSDSTQTLTLSGSTTLGELGVTSYNKFVINQNGTQTIIGVDASTTIDELCTELRNVGLGCGYTSGRFGIGAPGSTYIESIDADLKNALKLGDQPTYTVTSSTTNSNTNSKKLTKDEKQVLISKDVSIAKLSDEYAGVVKIYNNGEIQNITVKAGTTYSDLLGNLSSLGFSPTINDGQISFLSTDPNNIYVLDWGGVLGMTGNGYTTSVQTSGSAINTRSDHLQIEETRTINWDTTMEQLGFDAVDAYFDIRDKNGTSHLIDIDKTDTIRDIRQKLAIYDIAMNCANGKITLSGTNGAYIYGASNEITDALNMNIAWGRLGTTFTTTITPITSADINGNNIDVFETANGTVLSGGTFYIYKNGTKYQANIYDNDTIHDIQYTFEKYGITCTLTSDGRLNLSGDGDIYISTDGLRDPLDLAAWGLDNWKHSAVYKSDSPIGVTNSSSQITAANRDTQLAELGVTTGEYLLYKDGVKHTLYISSDETLGSFINTLRSFGIEAGLVTNGDSSTLKLHGNGDAYLKASSTSTKSNVIEQLFGSATVLKTYRYSGKPEIKKNITEYENISENTRINDIHSNLSGLKNTDTLNITFNDENIKVNITEDETVGSLLDKLRSIGLEATLSDGKIMIQSGYNTVNISGLSNGSTKRLGLTYNSDLGGYAASSSAVTSTEVIVETRNNSVAKFADANTKLGLLNISDGNLTIYRNGVKAEIIVDSEQTFGNLQSKIAAKFGNDVQLSFEEGFLTISSKSGADIMVGTTTDTSNFAAITGMHSDGKNSKSSRALYRVNNDSKVTTSGLFIRGQVTEGYFIVGNAKINIDNNTTLDDIISQINYNDDSNATAYWDSIDGKFVIKAKTTGAAMINIEAGSSNFTDIMGLTKNEDGKSKLNTDAQTLGQNARFTINGTNFTSTSNTISSEVSRIEGVTINLKDISNGETVTLTIEKDKETAANAISDIVDAYNELIANVDKEVARGANLSSESTLKLIRNQIRSLMTSSIANKGSFKNLASIGISLAAASSGNIRTDNINELSFDKDKFIESFGADLSSLKSLLVGTDEQKGILTQVEDV
ncbi:MAG: flagellar filament capping protein FliD, partial [Candidatus Gastranaerophilales bacterium]|nr:flagellar filament capping protein FliD [Candidatus Gastranaerophilales bacterium]